MTTIFKKQQWRYRRNFLRACDTGDAWKKLHVCFHMIRRALWQATSSANKFLLFCFPPNSSIEVHQTLVKVCHGGIMFNIKLNLPVNTYKIFEIYYMAANSSAEHCGIVVVPKGSILQLNLYLTYISFCGRYVIPQLEPLWSIN